MLKKYDASTEIKAFLAEAIPQNLIKNKPGQGNLTYISGCVVIDILNAIFGINWDWIIKDHWVQKSEPKFNPKYDKEPKPQGPVAHVIGELVIRLQDEDGKEVTIRKTAAGAKPIIGGQNEQKDIYKSASTDALKKAASLIGIGAQLYRDEDEQEYFAELNYEDPWTDEVLAAHQAEFDFLKELMAGDYSREEINSVLYSWSEQVFADINELPPDELTSFVAYLKEEMASEEEAAEG